MGILDRYIGKTIFAATFLSLFVLIGFIYAEEIQFIQNEIYVQFSKQLAIDKTGHYRLKF